MNVERGWGWNGVRFSLRFTGVVFGVTRFRCGLRDGFYSKQAAKNFQWMLREDKKSACGCLEYCSFFTPVSLRIVSAVNWIIVFLFIDYETRPK